MIELEGAAKAFGALGHKARLAVLRQLIPAGPDGVSAGAIGEVLNLPATRLSFHLHRLSVAGLIESRREGRHLYYSVRYAELGAVVGFLVNDCCAAAPEGCLPDCPAVPEPSSITCCPSDDAQARTEAEKG